MKKTFIFLLALVLALSLGLLMGTPVAADPGTTYYVSTIGSDEGDGSWHDPWKTIQHAVDTVISGDTIAVAPGTYTGAIVDKDVTISGEEGGSSIIDTGVCYNSGCSPAYKTAFRLDAGADGAEISDFTINCDVGTSFYFAIFGRAVDDVTIDSLEINDTVQGISNWGGSGWTITNNTITDTVAAGGGGIGIFLGALNAPSGYGICCDNLVQYNTIDASASAEDYSCPAICLSLDLRYDGYLAVNGSEDISGNQILDNTITASEANNLVGIEVGTILGDSETDPVRDDPDEIAAVMAAAAVHDNTVQDNSVDGADIGIFFYNVTDLTITENTVENNVGYGMYAEHGQSGTVITDNTFTNNDVQLMDDTDDAYLLDIATILSNNTFDRAVTVDHPGASLLHAIWSSIQDAIDAAEAGDTVEVAVGTYPEDGLYVDKSLTIIGAGESETTVEISRTTEGYGIYTSDDSDLELMFKDMTFEAVDNVRYFFFHIGHNKCFTLENVTVIGMGKDYYDGHGTEWANTVGGVDLIDLESGVLKNVTVSEASRNAISLSAVKSISLESITVEDSGARAGSAAVAIYTRDDYSDNNPVSINFSGGLITGAPIGLNLNDGALGVVGGDDIRDVVFTDNVVQAVASPDEAEALLAYNTFDRAVVVRGSPIKVPVIFSSIQDAIDAASAGDTVNVLEGTYVHTAQIVIDKNLTVIGEDKETTIIEPDPGFTDSYLFRINDGEVNLSNLTFDGKSNLYGGVRYTAPGTGTLSNNIFKDIVYPNYTGIGVVVYADNVTASDNAFTNIGRIGIWVGGDNALVTGNTYTGKGDIDCLDYGIEVGYGGVATITDNTITNCKGVASSDGSESAGILVTDYYGSGTEATITGNTLTGNTWGIAVGYLETDASVVVANYNNIFDNESAGIDQVGAVEVDARYNWWGDASGPYHETTNTLGTGDAVSDNVDYSPWWGANYIDVAHPWEWYTNDFIQDAVDAASAGDTVNVVAGTYTGFEVTEDDLTIQGPTDAVVSGAAPTRDAVVYVGSGVDSITIHGLTIDASGLKCGIRATESGTYSNIAVLDSIIKDFKKSGIVVRYASAVQLEGNNISTTDHSEAPNGIQVGNVGDITGTTGTIEGNQLSGCHWDGYDPETETYEDDWTGSGILVIDTGSALDISDNEVHSCDVGMDIESGTPTTVTNNDVHDNSYGFVLWNAAATINYNTIHENALYGVYCALDGSFSTVDATYNWWGSSSGPYHATLNPNGMGDDVSDNVLFEPWYSDEGMTTLVSHSTYEFDYDVPDVIVACEEIVVPVTFETDELGDVGYDGIRFKFDATGPGNVTFKATDSEEVEHTFVNSGYWGPSAGFNLTANYTATTDWSLNFSEPGEYTITFALIAAPDGEVIAGIEGSEIVTVRAEDIFEYYRMLHPPYDEVTTLDLLAAADDWIADVVPSGFDGPITTLQLLALADEWFAS